MFAGLMNDSLTALVLKWERGASGYAFNRAVFPLKTEEHVTKTCISILRGITVFLPLFVIEF